MVRGISLRFGIVLCMTVAAAAVAHADINNLVINGSFEDATIAQGGQWDIFTSLTGWGVARGPALEVQRGVEAWVPAGGQQYVELDSDVDGPNGTITHDNASSAIFQDIVTLPGREYELRFAFSPRPGVADNALEVKWNGVVLDTLHADGTGLSNTSWTYHTYVVPADLAQTRLEFGDRSASDSLGTFVDDVSVFVVVPEPAGILMLVGGVATLLRRR
jgi:hypothetical protein